jgi:magnesium-transporting ATPase (P-type)
VRYVFDEGNSSFTPYDFKVGPTHGDLVRQGVGLTSEEVNERMDLVGPNSILFPEDTWISATFKEFSGIFYLYQMMTLFIWLYYGYYYMGLVITFVIVLSGLEKVNVYLKAQKRVLSIASFSGTIRVIRNNAWVVTSTTGLVPGDVIQIDASEHVLPVDAVLINGGAVCDESSLTGEALPVVKFSIKADNSLTYVPNSDAGKNHSLFAGCHILEAQPSSAGRPGSRFFTKKITLPFLYTSYI